MKIASAAITSVLFLSFVFPVAAQTRPSTASATTEPSTQPVEAWPEGALARVGERIIHKRQVDDVIRQRLIAARRSPRHHEIKALRKQVLDQLIERALIAAYLEDVNLTDEQFAEYRSELAELLAERRMTMRSFLRSRGLTEADLREQAKIELLQQKYMSEERIQRLIDRSPVSWFDGTTVEAAHILIGIKPYASEHKKRQARQKLEMIARRLLAQDIAFDEAARQYSTGPSAQNGGALGAFVFPQMVPPFSKAAFALDPGQMSDIVETSFGYHLILVMARQPGTGEPGPKADDIATNVLAHDLKRTMVRRALKDHPVVLAPQLRDE